MPATNALKKSLGQHVLKNPGVVSTLVARARISPADTVLEVGPGSGNLTVKLLEKARRVVAIERDKRIAADLLKRLGAHKHKLQLIIGDAIEVEFPEFDMCVSNTPYQISSPLTFKLLGCRFRAAVLMFQREFALRLCASPGDPYYCRLSVSVQIRAIVQHVMNVSKKSFRPPPKVESSIVKIELKRNQPQIDLREFDGLVKLCFMRKNRTIGSIFRQEAVKNLIFGNKFADTWAQANPGAAMDDLMSVIATSEQSDADQQACAHKLGEPEGRLLNEALANSGLEKERASKMAIEDFLLLLLKFKEKGISFKG